MPSDVGSWFQQGPGNSGSSLGMVSGQPMNWTVIAVNSVSNTSEEIAPAASGIGRVVRIKVPSTATTGVCINFGAAATTSSHLIEPGEAVAFNTTQQIQAIRAGSVDVNVYVVTGVVP